MTTEPLLMSLRDLEIPLPPDVSGRIRRVRITVRMIVAAGGEEAARSFDMDEVADLVRARSEMHFNTFETLIQQLRDEVMSVAGVISCVVSVRDVDTYLDAEALHISTLPDPKHAVLYGVLL